MHIPRLVIWGAAITVCDPFPRDLAWLWIRAQRQVVRPAGCFQTVDGQLGECERKHTLRSYIYCYVVVARLLHAASDAFCALLLQLFFSFMALATLGVKYKSDKRDKYLHHGNWLVKLGVWLLFSLLPFFFPAGVVSVYGKLHAPMWSPFDSTITVLASSAQLIFIVDILLVKWALRTRI